MSSASRLHQDVMELVASCLSTPEFIMFGRVCRAWRAVEQSTSWACKVRMGPAVVRPNSRPRAHISPTACPHCLPHCLPAEALGQGRVRKPGHTMRQLDPDAAARVGCACGRWAQAGPSQHAAVSRHHGGQKAQRQLPAGAAHAQAAAAQLRGARGACCARSCIAAPTLPLCPALATHPMAPALVAATRSPPSSAAPSGYQQRWRPLWHQEAPPRRQGCPGRK